MRKSTKHSQNAMESTETLLDKIKELECDMQDLQNCNADLQLQVKEKEGQLRLMVGASPIKVFSKVRYGR